MATCVTDAIAVPQKGVLDSKQDLREKRFVKMVMRQQKKLERALRNNRKLNQSPVVKKPEVVPKIETNGYIDHQVDFEKPLSQRTVSSTWDDEFLSDESYGDEAESDSYGSAFGTENYLSPRTNIHPPADESSERSLADEEEDDEGLSGGLQFDIDGNVIRGEPEPEDQSAQEPTL